MSRPRRRDPRRNVLKPALEPLELRDGRHDVDGPRARLDLASGGEGARRDDEEKVAVAWILAFARGDSFALERTTELPFTFRSTRFVRARPEDGDERCQGTAKRVAGDKQRFIHGSAPQHEFYLIDSEGEAVPEARMDFAQGWRVRKDVFEADQRCDLHIGGR